MYCKKGAINLLGKEVFFWNLKGEEHSLADEAVDWYQGPKSFNLFYVNFNGLFNEKVEDLVAERDRIRTNTENLTSLAFVSDEMVKEMNSLINVVNYSSRPVISKARKKEYIAILKKIAVKIREYRGEIEDGLTICPMRGGSYFLSFLRPEKIYKDVLAIECKRIPTKEKNSFSFGMRIDEDAKYILNKEASLVLANKNVEKLRMVELCIVSGMTTIGFLVFLLVNGIRPKEIEINTIALSQQGYEAINRFAREYGFKVKFVTGGLYYRLGNFYLSHRDELLTLDEKLVIGDVRRFLD